MAFVGHCNNALRSNLRDCSAPYSSAVEELRRFCEKWTISPPTDPCFHEEFQYTHSSEIQGAPTNGWFATYGGGGYVVRFDQSQNDTMEKIEWLFDNRWMDSRTRALFLEFSIYNPNSNLYGLVS